MLWWQWLIIAIVAGLFIDNIVGNICRTMIVTRYSEFQEQLKKQGYKIVKEDGQKHYGDGSVET